VVDDNLLAIASNVEMRVTFCGVKVDTLSAGWDIGHGFRLNGSSHKVREHFPRSGAVVASDKPFVAEARVLYNDVNKYSLRAVQGLAWNVGPAALIKVSVKLGSFHALPRLFA